MKSCWGMWAVVLLGAVACSDDHSGRTAGTSGAPCYPNDTCNRGLVCEHGVCVEAPEGSLAETGGAGGTGGALATGGSAGKGGNNHGGLGGAPATGGMNDVVHDASTPPTSTDASLPDASVEPTPDAGAGERDAGASGGATASGGAGGGGGASGAGGATASGGAGGTAGAGGSTSGDGPHVQFIAPYIGVANRAGTFIARGQRFNTNGASVKVKIGTTVVGPIATDSDTQVTVNYPALAAGRYPVSIEGGDGKAVLVVIPASTLPYHEIDAPSRRSRLVFDAERQTLYALNPVDQEIERYQVTGTTWNTLTPYVLPHPTDMALSPDGRLLVILTQSGVSDVELDKTPFAAVSRADNSDTFCSKELSTFAMMNDGKCIITTFLAACSGFSETLSYDITTHAFTTGPYPTGDLYSGIVGGSLDGSRVYGGSNGVSPAQPITIWNALDDSLATGNPSYNLYAVTVSGNASRVIFQHTDVYSRSLTILGYLPSNGITYASHDSTRAFVYRDDNATPRLVVHDLTAALQSGAMYPVAKTVNLATSPVSSTGNPSYVAMTSTPDDGVVFVSGDSKLLVVPVH